MPPNAECFNGLLHRNLWGVVLQSNEIGVVNKGLTLAMGGDLLTGAVGSEARMEGMKGGEDDKVYHQPDGGPAGAALHDSVKGSGEDMERMG